MPDEKPKPEAPKVDPNHPKYCKAGKCLCNNVVIKDAAIGLKVCIVSSLIGAMDAQRVDGWTRCPCLEKAFYTVDPYEQAFLLYNRSLTEGSSETVALKIFKQAVAKHFTPREKKDVGKDS